MQPVKGLSKDEVVNELQKTFTTDQLVLVNNDLNRLLLSSETVDELVAKIYEVINVKTDEQAVAINTKINRLDTLKDQR